MVASILLPFVSKVDFFFSLKWTADVRKVCSSWNRASLLFWEHIFEPHFYFWIWFFIVHVFILEHYTLLSSIFYSCTFARYMRIMHVISVTYPEDGIFSFFFSSLVICISATSPGTPSAITRTSLKFTRPFSYNCISGLPMWLWHFACSWSAWLRLAWLWPGVVSSTAH